MSLTTTTTPAQLHATNDLVAVAWLRTLPGLSADGVATQLPADETKWAANGFVVVPAHVGGSPHSNMALRRPVVQVDCWGTVPGSDKLPWGIPSQLAEQIRAGTYDRTTFGRLLEITAGGVSYPYARVKSARMMTEPRRVWSDAGDYAGFSFDLALQWTSAGEEVQ
jgi:hypothetical protein